MSLCVVNESEVPNRLVGRCTCHLCERESWNDQGDGPPLEGIGALWYREKGEGDGECHAGDGR